MPALLLLRRSVAVAAAAAAAVDLVKARPDAGHPALYPGPSSRAQAEAGNYKKRRVPFHGLTLRVENEAGTVREGPGWQTRMLFPYGEVEDSEGVDGDRVDCYLGPHLDEATHVFVVHQRRAGHWSEYDEDKCMLGFLTEEDAAVAYLKHYDDPRFLGPITAMPVAEFVAKVRATRGAPAMVKGTWFGDADLLKATAKKMITVPGYHKADGTYVPPHQKMVHYNPDHSFAAIAQGGVSHSQKEAHKKLAKQDWFAKLMLDEQALHVMSLATEIQDAASASAAVSGWKAAAKAGKEPSAAQWAAFVALPKEKQAALYDEVKKAAGSLSHLSPPAPVEPTKAEPVKASPLSGMPAWDFLVKKINAGAAPDAKAAEALAAQWLDANPFGNSELSQALQDLSLEHVAAAMDLPAPDDDEPSQPLPEGHAEPSAADVEAMEAGAAKHAQEEVESGKPAPAELPFQWDHIEESNSLYLLPEQSSSGNHGMSIYANGDGTYKVQFVNEKGEVSSSWPSLSAMDAASKTTHMAVGVPITASQIEAAIGPKDGDTKPGANGGTLVFKDGRWHKQGEDSNVAEFKKEADLAYAEGNHVGLQTLSDEGVHGYAEVAAHAQSLLDNLKAKDQLEQIPKSGSFYQKEAFNELKDSPAWASLGPASKLAAVMALYKEKQGKASQSAAVSLWKKALLAGKAPSPAQHQAFANMAAQDPSKALALVNSVIGVIGNEQWTILAEQAKANLEAHGVKKPAAFAAPAAKGPAPKPTPEPKTTVVDTMLPRGWSFTASDYGFSGAPTLTFEDKYGGTVYVCKTDEGGLQVGHLENGAEPDWHEDFTNPKAAHDYLSKNAPGVSVLPPLAVLQELKEKGAAATFKKPDTGPGNSANAIAAATGAGAPSGDAEAYLALAKQHGLLGGTAVKSAINLAVAGNIDGLKTVKANTSSAKMKMHAFLSALIYKLMDAKAAASKALPDLPASWKWDGDQYATFTAQDGSTITVQLASTMKHLLVIHHSPGPAPKVLYHEGGLSAQKAASLIVHLTHEPIAPGALEATLQGMLDKAAAPSSAPAPIAPPATKTVTAPKTVYTNTTDGHNKQWAFYVAGKTLVTEFGPIGKTQQKSEKQFATAAAAEAAGQKLIKEKVGKGYVKKHTDYGHQVSLVEAGPKDGDTKQGADGTLVFKNGRWHKLDKPGPKLSKAEIDAAIPSLVGLSVNGKQAVALAKDYAANGNFDYVHALWSGVKKAKMPKAQNALGALVTAMNAKGATPFVPDLELHSAINHEVLASGFDELSVAGYYVGLVNVAKTAALKGDMKTVDKIYAITKGTANTSKAVLAIMAAVGKSPGGTTPAEPYAKPTPTTAPPESAAVVPKMAPAGAVKPGEPASMAGWTQTGPQKGSNPGGQFKDKNGQLWYVKFPKSGDVARNELLASKFYQMLGVEVPFLKLVEKDGKVGIASKWNAGVKKGSAASLAAAEGAHEGFVFDAWLANWDAVGPDFMNMQLAGNKAVRVDVGGSLLYRAQGGKKTDFGDEVLELDSLLDASKNSATASTFKGMSKKALDAGLQKLNMLKPSQIEELCEKIGPGSAAERKKLAATLIARRAFILKKYGVKDQWASVKALDPTKLPVNAKDLPKPLDFFTMNGGKGKSSKAWKNEQNNKVSADLIAFAAKGDLVALKDYKYAEITDNEAGTPTGKMKSIVEHPSKDIQEQWVGLVELLQSIATPSIPTLEMPSMGAVGALDEISDFVGSFSPTERPETVATEHRMGFFMALGQIEDIHGLLAGAKWSFIAKGGAWAQKMKAGFASLSALTRKYIGSVQASGSINHAWSQGKSEAAGTPLQKLTAEIYKNAVDIPEGTVLRRGMSDTTAGKIMTKQLLAAKPGLVIQNTDSMCTSYNEAHSWGGDVQMTIRCAKGCKATPSFASGSYGGEYEITTLPGQRYVVLGVEKSGSGVKLDVLMLPPHEGFVAEVNKLAKLGKALQSALLIIRRWF